MPSHTSSIPYQQRHCSPHLHSHCYHPKRLPTLLPPPRPRWSYGSLLSQVTVPPASQGIVTSPDCDHPRHTRPTSLISISLPLTCLWTCAHVLGTCSVLKATWSDAALTTLCGCRARMSWLCWISLAAVVWALLVGQGNEVSSAAYRGKQKATHRILTVSASSLSRALPASPYMSSYLCIPSRTPPVHHCPISSNTTCKRMVLIISLSLRCPFAMRIS